MFNNSSLPTVGHTTFLGFVSSDPITSLKIVTLGDAWVVSDLILATPGAAQGCGVILGSPSATFGSSGGVGSFGVVTAANCPNLSATSNSSWITLLPGLFVCPGSTTCPASPVDFGSVQFSVGPNPGGQRLGSVSIGSSTFNVLQGPPTSSCTYATIPDREVLNSGGGSASVVLVTIPGCPWSATSGASWLTVSRSTGFGRGNVTLRASANTTGATRSTTVLLGGVGVTVSQTSTSTIGTPTSACGAIDVTSEMSVHSSGLTPVGFGNWNEYSQTITITNNSGSAIPLPVYIVLVGEPTNFGYPYDTFLYGGGAVTKCFSPSGDYSVLPSPQGVGSGATTMPPGQTAGARLLWYQDTFAAGPRYKPIVISGNPNK